ncbi:MAG: hypothetical protein ACE5G1_00895, partial [bacterium]
MSNLRRSNLLHLLPLILFWLVLLSFREGQAVPRVTPSYGARHTAGLFFRIFQILAKPEPVISLQGYVNGMAPKFYNKIQQQVEIETLDSFIIVRQTILEQDVRPPLVISFDAYRNLLQDQTEGNAWHEFIVRDLTAQTEGIRGPGGINLDIPV